MKKTRRRYDRDFKISVLAKLDTGKPLAQIFPTALANSGATVGLHEELVPATLRTGLEFGGHLHATSLADNCEDELRPFGL